jgi:gamma-D-glutamyl-L-lysine dipeptidyl-peptidase
MTDIQSTLAQLAKETNKRTSVFEIEIQELKNSHVTLSGRLLDKSQLDELHRLLPSLKLDTVSVRILNRDSNERIHVATNLTGLYEEPTFDSPLSSELYYGTLLEVLDEKDNWVFTRQPDGYLGWTYRPHSNEGLAPAPTHLVLAPLTELRVHPDETSAIVTRLMGGTEVVFQDTDDGWSRVKANKSGWVRSSQLRAMAEIPTDIEEKQKLMASDAMRMIGIPYLWGGTSGNGIDCSGFTRLVHRWVGIDIPRDADMQYKAASPIEPPYEIGDLFFFGEGNSEQNITHVGICLGGWKVIHSSRGNNGVYIDDLQEKRSLMEMFVGAGSFLR